MSATEKLRQISYTIDALQAGSTMMNWDQQVMMPRGGAEARGEQRAVLSRLIHEQVTSAETARAIEAAGAEAAPGTPDAALARLWKRRYDKATKLPVDFVGRKSKLSSEAREAWIGAKAESDYSKFEPSLAQIIDLVQEECNLLGFKDHPYDAVTDNYEEGATKASWDKMFDAIRQPSVELLQGIQGSQVNPSPEALTGDWPQTTLRQFAQEMVGEIGFDMTRGRLDLAPHPFCTGFSVNDVRITTRFTKYLPSSIIASLHEAGHGVYAQGSPQEWDRLAIGNGVSLGVHESQSRTWENIVGRSKAFWRFFFPRLQQAVPELKDMGLDTWYQTLNRVAPTAIRVEADELTYNLHIMVRFEIECLMVAGKIKAKDLPEYWNEKYRDYLGYVPLNDAEGCLQDVHWSQCSVGYFPTYALGNVLSHQIWASLKKDIEDPASQFEKGDFKPVLEWLQTKIYQKGSTLTPQELVREVTGHDMDASHYLSAMRSKYGEIYAL